MVRTLLRIGEEGENFFSLRVAGANTVAGCKYGNPSLLIWEGDTGYLLFLQGELGSEIGEGEPPLFLASSCRAD